VVLVVELRNDASLALDQLHRHRFSNPLQDLGRPFGVADF
jgi:hypothetical protein